MEARALRLSIIFLAVALALVQGERQRVQHSDSVVRNDGRMHAQMHMAAAQVRTRCMQ